MAALSIQSSAPERRVRIVVGHMGTEELAAVALGNMWVAMVGMTLVYGGFSGLDTLASQAYGAKNYAMVGLWTQRATVVRSFALTLGLWPLRLVLTLLGFWLAARWELPLEPMLLSLLLVILEPR